MKINNKMGQKISASLIALFMLLASFTAILGSQSVLANGDTPPSIDVEKTVYDPETQTWVKSIDAHMTDIIYFNITYTYHNSTYQSLEHHLNETTVTDLLPSGLQYINANPTPQSTIGNVIVWHLIGYPDLLDGQSFTILLGAKVIDCVTSENYANVTGIEHCTGLKVYGESTATVYVPASLDVEKKVWNPDADNGQGAWVDELPYVIQTQNVLFQITSTYRGCGLMKCFVVWDELPGECLQYADNVTIKIAGRTISPNDPEYPEIIVGEGATIDICGHQEPVPANTVIWDWRNRIVGISDNQSVVIEFATHVTQYCECGAPVVNTAHALFWGCMSCGPCSYLHDDDTVNVYCCPPPSRFTKQVLDGQTWAEQTTAVVGDLVWFKLTFTYHGDDHVNSTIKILDQLPDCLGFTGGYGVFHSSDIQLVDSSGDTKTMWWNFTGNLTESQTISIQFSALVTNTTECCEGINTATIWVRNATGSLVFESLDTASVIGIANTPPSRPVLNGPTSGKVNDVLTFTVGSDDLEGDQVYYILDWDTGIFFPVLGPFAEGVTRPISKAWTTAGTYHVRAKAKDTHNAESDWSFNTITVVITGGEQPPQGDNITITLVTVKSSGVTATIKNNGTENGKLINWTITVEGKLFFTRKNVETIGNVTLNATKTADITGPSHAKRFPFGRFTITIVADAGVYGKATAIKTGFMLGPIVRVN